MMKTKWHPVFFIQISIIALAMIASVVILGGRIR